MKYIFWGKVHPERAAFSLTNSVSAPLKGADNDFEGNINVLISVSQVMAELDTSAELSIVDLKNIVENFVHVTVDVFGYLKGYAYSVEISSVFIPETSYSEVFGVDVAKVTKDEPNRPLNYNDTLLLAMKSPELSMALADLRNAIQQPLSTFFHCRRAIETIARHFAGSGDLTKGDWNQVTSTLGLDENEQFLIRDAAVGQRHGLYRSVTGEERVEIMMKTWRVVDKFILYLRTNDNSKSK